MRFLFGSITTLLTATLCFSTLYNKYELKKKNMLAGILMVIGIIILKIFILYIGIPPLNLMSTLCMNFAVIYFLYKCKFKTVLIYSLIFLMIALISDVIGVMLVSAFHHDTITQTLGTTDTVWHRYIWIWILQIFLSRIVSAVIQKNDNIKVKWHEILFYIVLLAFEITFFAMVSTAIQDYMSGKFLIFVMLGFGILDIYIMFILHQISLSRDVEQKINLMQQQEQLHLQMYQKLREKYNSTYAVSHDINRHISSLKALIKSNPNTQAERYLSDLTKETDRLRPIIKNQNAMLEIILNIFSERCEKENIDLNMNVEDFSLDFISDIDITTIFSNLLDNAVEASVDPSNPYRKINIVLKKQMGLIVFRITNLCPVTKNEWSYKKSTKPNHSGIGLSNVQKAVEKYDGVMNVVCENNQFCVSLTFST